MGEAKDTPNERKPSNPEYGFDALVDFWPPSKQIPNYAYGLVKLTYDFRSGFCQLVEPLPLEGDLRESIQQDQWPPETDCYPIKLATDVIVQGQAFSRGPALPQREVGLQVGERSKRIWVFGDRVASWQKGHPVFSEPEPFETMPLTRDRAYGGCDQRVPFDPPKTEEEAALLQVLLQHDHPGIYPRNPFGRGYIVLPDDPGGAIPLPNLENISTPLTPYNLIVRDPLTWFKQPLPAILESWHPMMFPRYAYAGAEPWSPIDPHIARQLEEVRQGWLPPEFQQQFTSESPEAIGERYFQDAPPDQCFPFLEAGTPISCWGMHPEVEHIQFALPPAPRISLQIERDLQELPARLTKVTLEPHLTRVSLVYTAVTDSMPRQLIPGIHADIPLFMKVNDAPPIRYECPPTIRQRLKDAASASSSETAS